MTQRFPLGLSARQLQAFQAVAATLNFSQAAATVSLSVPALSQRIRSLEKRLGQDLFVRHKDGVTLTAAGRRLIHHAQAVQRFEEELNSNLVASSPNELGGTLRIVGFSSTLRSVMMPALDDLARHHPGVTLQFSKDEMHNVQGRLMHGEADLAVTHFPIARDRLESVELGIERNYLVESSTQPTVDGVYIDHDPDDHFTEIFFSLQGGIPQPFRRVFYDDIYGLIDAVERGLGRAVIPMHLLRRQHSIRTCEGFVAMDTPVILSFRAPMKDLRLIDAAIALLKANAPRLLARDELQCQARTGRKGVAAAPCTASSTL